MTARTSVLIAGGGIAGLAAANALAELDGYVIDVVDPDPRPHGVAVGLSACALRGLHAIRALEPVLRASAPSTTLHMCDSGGATILRVERAGPIDQPYPDNVIVDRSSLSRSLTGSLRDDKVTLVTGVSAVNADLVEDGVVVSFSTGESRRYDLMVAADGAGSRLRGIVAKTTPRPLDQLGLRWVTGPVPDVDHGVMFLGPRAVKLGLWPLADGSTYAFLTLPRPGRDRPTRHTALAELREALRAFTFSGAARLRAEVPWDEVHVAGFSSMILEEPCHRGRVVLVGDAAHVMPPHGSSGAAMAVEDAFVLADELARGDIDEALWSFDRRRRDRVRRVVEYSTSNCVAENDAARAGLPAPVLDAQEALDFWEFLRQSP